MENRSSVPLNTRRERDPRRFDRDRRLECRRLKWRRDRRTPDRVIFFNPFKKFDINALLVTYHNNYRTVTW